MRKSIAVIIAALTVFAGFTAVAPASAQAAGIWVYVQSWLAPNEEDREVATLACRITAHVGYPGRNHDCRHAGQFVQLWVEY